MIRRDRCLQAAADAGIVAAGRIRLSAFSDMLTEVLLRIRRSRCQRAERLEPHRVPAPLPRDPFSSDPQVPAAETWNVRSYASRPDDPQPGEDVFDVSTKSTRIALDRTPGVMVTRTLSGVGRGGGSGRRRQLHVDPRCSSRGPAAGRPAPAASRWSDARRGVDRPAAHPGGAALLPGPSTTGESWSSGRTLRPSAIPPSTSFTPISPVFGFAGPSSSPKDHLRRVPIGPVCQRELGALAASRPVAGRRLRRISAAVAAAPIVSASDKEK